MENSISYRFYTLLKSIYLNSKTIKMFSSFFEMLFNILINSKVFICISNTRLSEIFKESLMWKLIIGIMRVGTKVLNKTYIKDLVKHSYFVQLMYNITDKKSKNSINNLFLIPIIMLIVNMVIKILTGSFNIVGNRYLIGLLTAFIVLYSFQLDYWVILKNSIVFRACYEVFFDESLDYDN